MARVGRQDRRFPIWRNAPPGKAASSASTVSPFRDNQQRTRISGVGRMLEVAENVGRERAEKGENLVFALCEDRLPELSSAWA
jgi:hypothetical protein